MRSQLSHLSILLALLAFAIPIRLLLQSDEVCMGVPSLMRILYLFKILTDSRPINFAALSDSNRHSTEVVRQLRHLEDSRNQGSSAAGLAT